MTNESVLPHSTGQESRTIDPTREDSSQDDVSFLKVPFTPQSTSLSGGHTRSVDVTVEVSLVVAVLDTVVSATHSPHVAGQFLRTSSCNKPLKQFSKVAKSQGSAGSGSQPGIVGVEVAVVVNVDEALIVIEEVPEVVTVDESDADTVDVMVDVTVDVSVKVVVIDVDAVVVAVVVHVLHMTGHSSLTSTSKIVSPQAPSGYPFPHSSGSGLPLQVVDKAEAHKETKRHST